MWGMGAIRLSAADTLGNPVHAGPLRLVPRGGLAAVSVPGGCHRDGDREAVEGLGGHWLCYNITSFHASPSPTSPQPCPRPHACPQPRTGIAPSGAGRTVVDPAHACCLP